MPDLLGGSLQQLHHSSVTGLYSRSGWLSIYAIQLPAPASLAALRSYSFAAILQAS